MLKLEAIVNHIIKSLIVNCNEIVFCKLLCRKHYDRNKKGIIKKELDKSLWTDVNIAWLSGLLEGEGCFYIYKVKYSGEIRVKIQLNMTDFDIIEKVYQIFRCGRINGPYQPKGNRKPNKIWNIQGYPALEILINILPYMGNRRSEKIKECIKLLKKNLKNGRNIYE